MILTGEGLILFKIENISKRIKQSIVKNTQNQLLSKLLTRIENLLVIGTDLLILGFLWYTFFSDPLIFLIGVFIRLLFEVVFGEYNIHEIQTQYQQELKLIDGRILQIINDLGYLGSTEVRINHQIPEDGFYLLSEKTLAYEIEGGKIKMEYYIEIYEQEDEKIIEFGGSRINGICEGCPVWLNGEFAPDGEYKKGWFSKVKVEKGRIK